MTLAITYEVFSRYVFSAPTTWAYDVSYMLYGTLFMMAGPYALARNGHVRAISCIANGRQGFRRPWT